MDSELFVGLFSLCARFAAQSFCSESFANGSGVMLAVDRRLVLLELINNVNQLSALLNVPAIVLDGDDDGFEHQFETALQKAQATLEAAIAEKGPGSGHAVIERSPQLVLPGQGCYDKFNRMPDTFQMMCAYSPEEFEDLHNDVLDVLEMVRDIGGVFTTTENAMRKKRRYKFTSRERLFNFLTYCRHYPRLRKGSTDLGIGKTALVADVWWLREQLTVHPLMIAECSWPTPDEIENERRSLVRAGLLTAGFENSVFMCDGTKDLGRRNAHYGHKHEPDYSQKGNGKSHLLFTNLFGAPIMLAAGIQGCENDPAAYHMTHVYRDPDAYLKPHHTGLFDGVFQSALHVHTDEPGTLPANAADLKRASPEMRKMLKQMNKVQRYLRCPIEQTFGLIKQWEIVGEAPFRGSLDQQGENFMLCTQLTARIMRVRNAYPRGVKWMRGEMEDWEREWAANGQLYVDPLHPELYDEVEEA